MLSVQLALDLTVNVISPPAAGKLSCAGEAVKVSVMGHIEASFFVMELPTASLSSVKIPSFSLT
jgi:hypothetical protein